MEDCILLSLREIWLSILILALASDNWSKLRVSKPTVVQKMHTNEHTAMHVGYSNAFFSRRYEWVMKTWGSLGKWDECFQLCNTLWENSFRSTIKNLARNLMRGV